MVRLASKAAIGVLVALSVLAAPALARPFPSDEAFKPKSPVINCYLGGDGIQAGVWAPQADGSVTNFPATSNYAETQIAHESAIFPPLVRGGAFSYSLVGVTSGCYVLRMGYIVLEQDRGNARWFIRVYDPNGQEVYWKLSRSGEANPPPACSACSGDTTTMGYPFSFGMTRTDTWNFWFDWISKGSVTLPADAGRTLIAVYFVGEVSHQDMYMSAREALTTFRVNTGSGALTEHNGNWYEPLRASVFHKNAGCNGTDQPWKQYDVQREATAAYQQTRSDGKIYKSTRVGSLQDNFGNTTIVGPVCGPFVW